MALYVLESCVAWDKSIMKAVSVARESFKFSILAKTPPLLRLLYFTLLS